MNIIQVPLGQFLPNPFQPRESEDAEHIEKIAASILEEGLLQAPVGRLCDANGMPIEISIDLGSWDEVIGEMGCQVELAFGHSRLAAFRKLVDAGKPIFETMPVHIRDISDEDMFRFAISENLARKDLSPIEEAKAMLVYREQFKKTSGEIGKLFGIGESAVRNKMRLLDLPEGARQKLDQGEISEGTARQLLTLQVVAEPKKVEEMAAKLANGGYESPEKIKEEISQSMRENSKEMWGGYYANEGEPRGGVALWPLNWVPDFEMCINTDALKRVMQKDWPELVRDHKKLEIYFQQIWDGLGVAETAKKYDIPFGFLELVNVLIHKTPCSGCPFYARMEGRHYCGQEACWKAKRDIWFGHELREASEKMGIAIYDPERDGKDIITPRSGGWEDHVDNNFSDWVKKKNPGLRLKAHYEEYSENKYTQSKTVELVMVGEAAEKKKLEIREKKGQEDQRSQNRQSEWELRQKRQEASLKFIQSVAAPVFASLLEGIQNLALLEWLINRNDSMKDLPKNRTERVNILRRLLMDRWIREWMPYGVSSEGPAKIAEHLQGLAVTLGLELPATWMELAEQSAGGAGVSMKTEE